MALLYWQTERTLNRLHQYLYRLVSNLIQASCESTLWIGESGANWITQIQVSETEGEICLSAKIPNVVAKSLEVDVTPETVKFRGEQLESSEQVDGFEFCPSRFQSIVPLPDLVEPHTAIAQFQDNVLTLTLQKSPQAKRQVKAKILFERLIPEQFLRTSINL